MPRRSRFTLAQVALGLAVLLLASCGYGDRAPTPRPHSAPESGPEDPDAGEPDAGDPEAGESEAGEPEAGEPEDSVSRSDRGGRLTLAFAGDVHFEAGLTDLPRQPGATLGPMSRHLRSADLAVVNLESALAQGGEPTRKELEDPSNRYWFRTPPSGLRLLDRSGVDVVSIANNHGADFGAAGLRESLAAAEDAPVAVVGVGKDAEEAFTPHRATINGTDVSVLAADASFRESDAPIWAAGEGGPGVASARDNPPEQLLTAVREADAEGDVVVVYLHWGVSREACPTDQQQRLARQLSSAGADVVVGAAAHVLQGAGMLGETYVGYGLGNFLWYHGAQSRTGVLKVDIANGQVVGDDFVPARIPAGGGQPRGFGPDRRPAERSAWESLRGCTALQPAG